MTKRLDPHEKECRRLVRLVEAGKLEVDSNIIIIDCDGLAMIMRADLIMPFSYDIVHMELRGITSYKEWEKIKEEEKHDNNL